MKTFPLTLLFLILSVCVYSQKVIENPVTGFTTAQNIKITKIELSDSATTLRFHTRARPGDWINIPGKTYIQAVGDGEKLFITGTKGIPFRDRYTMPDSGIIDYTLFFPPINKSVTKIDYGEANTGGNWFIYDIALNPSLFKSELPEVIAGNWFNKTTGDWEVGFYETMAVYKMQVWKYNEINKERKRTSIALANDTDTLKLYITKVKDGTFMMGESPKELKLYCNDVELVDESLIVDNSTYKEPVFNQDSSIYSGYLKGFHPRFGDSNLKVHVTDIITGEQNSSETNIDDYGFFSIKIPMYYPHVVWVRSSFYNGSVFLEPGKELFQLIDPGTRASLYMGDLADVNADLELMNVYSFNSKKAREQILDITPSEYKANCQEFLKKDLQKLDSLCTISSVSAKACQVEKYSLLYQYAENLMDYKNDWRSAYRQEHNISRRDYRLIPEPEGLKNEYFDFITDDFANDPLAVLAESYGYFINRLKYLDMPQKGRVKGYSMYELAKKLQESGYTLTESENSLVEIFKEIDELQNLPEQKEFGEKYLDKNREFFMKYRDTLQNVGKIIADYEIDTIKVIFNEKGIDITSEEIQFLEALKEHQNLPSSIQMVEMQNASKDLTQAFHKKHRTFISDLYRQKAEESRKADLTNVLGIQPGLAFDLMTAQGYCRNIVAEFTPVSESELVEIQKEIDDPFISEYVAICNQQTIAKIEANKLKTGFIVNEVPQSDTSLLFSAIMEKYKGSVVYVDFWATWCGPCRAGIQRIKSLKEEMKDDNVKFVYISAPSSPEGTWSNMITDIKGEHYRVSDEQWKYLCDAFDIQGIPHYALVGKNGEVVNPKLGHMSNDGVKDVLTKEMNK